MMPLESDADLDTEKVNALLDDLLASALPTTPVSSSCWSSQFCGASHPCTPGFEAGLGHFKNKFCERCRRDGILIGAERVVLMTPILRDRFANSNGHNVWTNGARIVNQTMKCTGPAAIIFQGKVPEATAALAEPVPDNWLYNDESTFGGSCIHFIISKGTLVPMSAVPRNLRARACHKPHPQAEEVPRVKPTAKRRHDDDACTRSVSLLPPSAAGACESTDSDAHSRTGEIMSPSRGSELADDWVPQCVYSVGSLEPPGLLQPAFSRPSSPFGMAPLDRPALLAAHLALEQQIMLALGHAYSGNWGGASEEVFAGTTSCNPHVAHEACALAPLDPLSTQETQVLSNLLPILRLSSTTLQASRIQCGATQPCRAQQASSATTSVSAPSSGYPPPLTSTRPSTACTLPPSPPYSRPSTADTRSHAVEETAELASATRVTKVHTVGTQTAVGPELAQLVLHVLSAYVVGMAGAICLSSVIISALLASHLVTQPSMATLSSVALGALGFNLAVGLYVCMLRKLGVLDRHSAHLLAATWFGRTYRCCCLLRQERYRVMDHDGDVPIYPADKHLNQRQIRGMSAALAFCATMSTVGYVLFSYNSGMWGFPIVYRDDIDERDAQ